ncbi:MAG: hypothetical protein PHR61_00280 [Candidatus Absconditabacteria bacterium]|nr:hypothetical protein [Candidatus Absconditabacteria bacterium]
MLDYIQPIINQITSTRGYIIYTLGAKTGRTPWIVEYVIVLGILYIIAVYILHKIYRFFVSSTKKQKADYFLACDKILYEFQLESSKNYQDLERIKDITKKASYEESYKFFVEKTTELESDVFQKQLKNTYQSYNNALRRKTFCGIFLLLITLGIYKLFLEN